MMRKCNVWRGRRLQCHLDDCTSYVDNWRGVAWFVFVCFFPRTLCPFPANIYHLVSLLRGTVYFEVSLTTSCIGTIQYVNIHSLKCCVPLFPPEFSKSGRNCCFGSCPFGSENRHSDGISTYGNVKRADMRRKTVRRRCLHADCITRFPIAAADAARQEMFLAPHYEVGMTPPLPSSQPGISLIIGDFP